MEERLDQRWKGIGANASFCAIMFKNLDISYPCFAPAHLTYLGCKQLQVKTRTLMRPNVSPAAAECWSIAKSCRDGCGGFAAGWRKNWNWKGGVKIISIHCYLFNLHCSLFLPPPTPYLQHSIFPRSATSTRMRRFTSFKSLLFYANNNSDTTSWTKLNAFHQREDISVHWEYDQWPVEWNGDRMNEGGWIWPLLLERDAWTDVRCSS